MVCWCFESHYLSLLVIWVFNVCLSLFRITSCIFFFHYKVKKWYNIQAYRFSWTPDLNSRISPSQPFSPFLPEALVTASVICAWPFSTSLNLSVFLPSFHPPIHPCLPLHTRHRLTVIRALFSLWLTALTGSLGQIGNGRLNWACRVILEAAMRQSKHASSCSV